MKWVSMVVRHSRLDEVVAALGAIGITRLTMTEVEGCGEHVPHADAVEEEGLEYEPDFTPHVQIELALPDEHLPEAIERVLGSARTGRIGDGRIMVRKLESAVRIRSGERGEAAL